MVNEEKQTIELVKKATPAVVSITISKTVAQAKEMAFGNMLHPSFLPDFPADALPVDDNQKIKVGGGSGFIVDSNGIILTNKHVVIDGEAEYTVTTSDDTEYTAKVLTRDPINDIAILKIEAKDLPTLKMSSSAIQPGQTVLAIGNALGLFSNTVSKGIVSGLSRKISAAMGGGNPGEEGGEEAMPQVEELRGVIQTDVAINQGNSGGPLLNLDGEVVGINTAVIYGAQNIGFSIPIQWAKNDLADLQKFGRIIRPYIGLRYIMLNKEMQKRYKLSTDYGALITPGHLPGGQAVIKNSPAEKAGLKENDIILEVNGQKLDEKSDLQDKIQLLNAGDEISLSYLRKDKPHTAKLLLEERK
ncbi:MAG: trypsin-like peptidase domain-containing protein [bacterium]|nr:trypsin-like peptidase domain-containing protein [bacterium]